MNRCLLSSLCFLFLANCASDPTVGYSSASLYAPQFKSIAVPIIQNNSMAKGIEFLLTDAIVKEIESRTPYLILGEQYADTLLTGTIQSVVLRTISQSTTTGLDNEVMITVTMDFEWLNLQSGGRIMGRRNFSSSALFVPSRPSAEPIEMGQFAVVQQLSADIVDQMQSSW
jgi:hypothetical protein